MTNQSGLTFAQSARSFDFTGFLASNSIGSVQSGLKNVKGVWTAFYSFEIINSREIKKPKPIDFTRFSAKEIDFVLF